jgi:hypothetical protein
MEGRKGDRVRPSCDPHPGWDRPEGRVRSGEKAEMSAYETPEDVALGRTRWRRSVAWCCACCAHAI